MSEGYEVVTSELPRRPVLHNEIPGRLIIIYDNTVLIINSAIEPCNNNSTVRAYSLLPVEIRDVTILYIVIMVKRI